MKKSQNIQNQLAQRKKDLIGKNFDDCGEDILFITSSTDIGVIRNGGRRGSAHGPTAILAQLKKMIAPVKNHAIKHCETADDKEEVDDFTSAQKLQAEKIKNILPNSKPMLHLGGGHDHVYPLIKAVFDKEPNQKIHILNLDAHLDTRQDELFHSGTPLRQLGNEFKDRLKITQIGIHPYANAASNYIAMGCEMDIWASDRWNNKEITKFFNNIKDDECLIISLDADSLNANIMEAVSAVNHQGLEGRFVSEIFDQYFSTLKRENWIVGIYEYNPIFDNLSNKGSRFLASLIYKMFILGV